MTAARLGRAPEDCCGEGFTAHVQDKEGVRSVEDRERHFCQALSPQCEHFCTDSSNVIHFPLGGIISIMEHEADIKKKLSNTSRL